MAPFFTGITRAIGGAGFGKRAGGGGVTGSGIVATGGDIANALAPGNGYLYHTFSTPGSLVVTTSKTVELLMVAGGGGSGGGGGGAGGLLYHPSLTLSTGTYTVSVGSGGLGYDSVSVPAATPGGDTILSYPTFTATTKGGGGDGLPGGSGGSAYGSPYGWGTYNPAAPNTTQPTFPQPGLPPGYLQYGNSTGLSMFYSGGGGGGAGGIGGNSTATGYTNNSNNPTPGGIGRQYLQFLGPLIGIPPLNPHNGYFAGGGGSGSGRDGYVNNAESGQIGTGGAGGGGNGGSHSGGQANNDHTAGVNYLGGGGGGSSRYPQNYPGKNGGSGILCIRYLAS